jgi:hypothetical protein
VDQEGDSMNNYTKDRMVAISVQSYLVQVWSYSLDCRSAALWGIWGGRVSIWMRTTDSGLPGLYCGLLPPVFLDGVHLQHRGETRERSGTSARCIEYCSRQSRYRNT